MVDVEQRGWYMHMADQAQKRAQWRRSPGTDLDLGEDNNRMAEDTVEGRKLAAAGRGMAGRAERGWRALESEQEECRRMPGLDVTDGENEDTSVPPPEIVDWTLAVASVDGTVAAAAVEAG